MNTFFTVMAPEASVEDLDPVVDFALDQNAHLLVAVLSVAVAIPTTVFPGVPSYGGEMAYELAINDAKLIAESLEGYLSDKNVFHTVVPVCQPILGIATELSKVALYSDLVVLTANTQWTNELYRRALDGVLFRAGLPTIVLPETMSGPLQLKRLLLAWHPDNCAARAMRSVVPMLDEGSELTIAIVDPTDIVYGPSPGDDFAKYLARKHINVDVDTVTGNGRSVAQALKQAAIDHNVDAVVMGAFGHSRMRETIFGGTTKEMLTEPPCPLFLCH